MVGRAGFDFATEDWGLVLMAGALEREVGSRLAAIVGVVDSGDVTLFWSVSVNRARW